jgi:uracil-DNA glycosylase family 4
MAADSLRKLDAEIVRCRSCPRLVAWREEAARLAPRRFCNREYWARPIPGFGDPEARVVVVGLAPAAHGGNRTGRVFTGDASGDWLFRALHATGFANQPRSTHAGDGLALSGARVTAAVRCAPPANRPTPAEERRCLPYLVRELALLDAPVVVCLGGIAWRAVLRVLRERGVSLPRPRPRFGHGVELTLPAAGVTLLASYHPSQQNTFTGRLTARMLASVFARARRIASRRSCRA